MLATETPYVSRMNAILDDKRKAGMRGIRLFVSANKDATSEDVAHDFCEMESAFAAGKCRETTGKVF